MTSKQDSFAAPRQAATFVYERVSSIVNVEPRTHRIKTKEYLKAGCIPVVDQGQDAVAGYIEDAARAYQGPLPVVVFGDHTCCFKFVDFRFAVGADGTQLLTGKKGVDTRYLYYALQTAEVEQFGYQRHFKLLKDSKIPVPPLRIQQRIASILGAYDDLIDLNRRRIALLEKIATRLFEEWFVNFRFPGHEDHPPMSAGTTRVPKGWRIAKLKDVAAVNADTLRPADAPTRIGYVDISSVTIGTIQKVEWMAFADAPSRARRRVKDGSIIWSTVRPNRRSYALVLHPVADTVVSTGFAVLDAQALPFAYLFHAVTTDDFVGYLIGNATGAAYPAVTGTVFERATILIPPDDLTNRFAIAAEPMMRLAAKLKEANAKLEASRGLLLPRLVSGELSVAPIEQRLGTAA